MMNSRCLLVLTLGMVAAPVAASNYVVVRREILVERPAESVWQRIGSYCAIGEWLKVKCTIVAGNGGVGTVRQLNGVTIEPMVGSTALSYTYAQTAGTMAALNYHGTLAVEPVGARRSRIVYTLVYDAASMTTEQLRKAQFDRISARFQGAIETMKELAEAQK
ncbi:SRPBCC family protein [Sphingomonas oligophenolica]|uniref:SRPBCC family protein n=1 Tax=Sphingomonas oligophenolica TaxID=301154 RepID=A0ABU9Y125_9SPHN